ncbi:methionine aminopeptidase 2 [Trichoderma arundinaceum]|uniref:Methionine aminopeptidase 2 n=1 Tax=Trichoderma arundinaceum TaxID=490622 RepID=A0A395NAQ9_TRIAR|nr:methionine aminopeptidase 2 [Trichoderma arundinaceum]
MAAKTPSNEHKILNGQGSGKIAGSARANGTVQGNPAEQSGEESDDDPDEHITGFAVAAGEGGDVKKRKIRKRKHKKKKKAPTA